MVVQAAKRSGSLVTARNSLEQGREVMAVPGAPNDPRSVGTNQLIKQGATLVTCVDDVLECVPGLKVSLATSERAQASTELSSTQKQLVRYLAEQGEIGVYVLEESLGISASQLTEDILELELLRLVEHVPGDRLRLRNTVS